LEVEMDVVGSGREASRSPSQGGSNSAVEEEEVGHSLHDENDDADDEGDGSHTHVEEGSAGYKEYEGLRGSEATQELGETLQDEDSPMRVSQHSVLHEDDNSPPYRSHEEDEGERQPGEDVASAEGGEEEGGIRYEQWQERGEWPLMSGGLVVEERQEEDEGDTLPPGRVMLMERLCNLVQRLSSVRVGGGMEADVIEVLNAKVDEMEDLLVLAEETAEAEATAEVKAQADAEEQTEAEADAEAEPGSESEAQQAEANQEREEAGTEGRAEAQENEPKSGSEESSKWASGRSSTMLPIPLLQVDDQDIRDLASPLPWLTSTFRFSELSISPSHSHPELAAATNEALEAAKRAAQAQAEMAERVAAEAEKLNLELAAVVKRLQARKEESDVSPSTILSVTPVS
jgi:hypothetical protein